MTCYRVNNYALAVNTYISMDKRIMMNSYPLHFNPGALRYEYSHLYPGFLYTTIALAIFSTSSTPPYSPQPRSVSFSLSACSPLCGRPLKGSKFWSSKCRWSPLTVFPQTINFSSCTEVPVVWISAATRCPILTLQKRDLFSLYLMSLT